MLPINNFFRRSALGTLALAASLPLVLTGCQDEEFGYAAEDIKYAKAFENFFGEMPADKNWDLSSFTNHYRYDATPSTRAAGTTTGNQLQEGNYGEYQVKDQWWEVPQKTYDWMKAALKEGKDNRYLGSPFVLQLPDNDFAIIPIFQGKSSIMSELEVKINGYQITRVWTRSENIQVKDSKYSKFAGEGGWMNIGYYDGYSSYQQNDMKTQGDACMVDGVRDWSKLPMHPSYTDESEAVRARPIYFRAKDKIGRSDRGFMYLSLHNIDKAWASWTQYKNRWDEGNSWTTIGHRLTSINPNGHMLALNVPSQYRPSPSELPDICEDDTTKPSQVIFVSCEDANGTGTDHDVNDVAFLIIGYPNAPTIVPTTEIIKKRYMCEDLGGTYDYDFNDIVVDVTQTRNYKVKANPDDLENYDESVAGNITIQDMEPDGCPVQTAKVARLCGTIPVQIQIGSFMFPKIKNPRSNGNKYGVQEDPDGEYGTRVDLDGQDPNNGYHLYHHNHCSTCGGDHNNPAEGSRIDYAHKDFTRSGEADFHNTTKGWNPNEEQIIPCHTWNPDDNNIIIYADWGFYKKMYSASDVNNTTFDQSTNSDVKHNNQFNPFPPETQDFADFASGKKFAVTFPKNGEYPYIIATDQDVPWMKESQHIPEGWIKGDMTARSSDETGSNHDLIGNSFYMERYPASDAEGYIWSGDVTGLAYSTGVTFANPSAELAALKESFDHQYFLLHVYLDVPAGESASIGLYSADDWKPILNTDADGYYATAISNRAHQTYIGVDNNAQCATVYLTTKQREDILAHGLVVVSRTDGVRIKKVTTARPCMYDPSAPDVPTKTGNTVNVDAGFIVNITKSEVTNGWILSDESERLANIIKKEEGKELSAEQTAHNNAEPGRVIVPFETRQFISGTTVTLTAIGKTEGDLSYRVTGWKASYKNASASDFVLSNTNPLTIQCTNNTPWDWGDSRIKQITVYPTFKEAINPRLAWEENPTETSKTITLALNGAQSCKLYANSLNMSQESLLDQFGGNTSIVGASFGIEGGKHVITLTPNNVGETTFTIYQKDGEYNDTQYGVSGELKLTVKVIEEIPAAEFSMDKSWIYRWNGNAGNAYILDDSSSLSLEYNVTAATSNAEAKEVLYGDANTWGYAYADLSEATTLIVEVAQGDIELIFNREGTWGAETKVDASHKACSVVYNGTSGAKAYVIDLTQLRANGTTRLNAIREANGAVATKINSIKVNHNSSTVVDTWKTLKGKIAFANKPQYSTMDQKIFEWSDESVTAGIVSKDHSHHLWKNTDATKATAEGEVIFGHESSHSRHYVDLSAATVLVVTIPFDLSKRTSDADLTKELFFQFNKEYGTNGYGSAKEIRPTDRDLCAVVNSGDTRKYVIDIDGFKNKYGVEFAHLNAINSNWGAENAGMYISDIKVDAYYSRPEDLFNMSFPVDFSTSMMHNWSGSTVSGTPSDCQLNIINTASDVVLGTGGIYGPDTYVDLSSAKWLKVTMSSYNELRFWFNKTSSDNTNYLTTSSPYIYHFGNSIYVDIEGIKNANGGKVHLHGIKSSGPGTNVTVTEIKLDAYTEPSGDLPVNMTSTPEIEETYRNIVKVSGLSIWNDVLKSGGITNYTGLKFTIHLTTGINDFYIYNNQGVENSGEKKFSTQLKEGDNWINGASWNGSTREVTYTLSKSDFETYFQGVDPQSDVYFGGNCPLADKVTVQVIR